MPDALKSVMPQAVAPKANKSKPPDEPVVARTDLDKAMARAESVDRRQKMSQEAMADAAASAVYAGETLATNFLASVAEGYLGNERMKLAGVDPRPVLGLSTMGYGVYRILTWQAGGGHLLALGAVRAARATSEGAGEPEPEDSTTNHTKGVDHGQR